MKQYWESASYVFFTNSIMAPSALEKFSCPMSLAVLAETVKGI
jgi:hypothetical protein